MDTTVRALLLLLFLHLSPHGALSYPLGDSSEASEKFPGLQELLERILMQLSQLEIEQQATESPQQSESTTQTWETRQTRETRETQGTQGTTAAPRLRQSQDGTTQARNKSYSTQMKQKLGCFGRRVDRLGSSGSLGCDGFQKP